MEPIATEYIIGYLVSINGYMVKPDVWSAEQLGRAAVYARKKKLKEDVWGIYNGNQVLNKQSLRFECESSPSNREENHSDVYRFSSLKEAVEFWEKTWQIHYEDYLQFLEAVKKSNPDVAKEFC